MNRNSVESFPAKTTSTRLQQPNTVSHQAQQRQDRYRKGKQNLWIIPDLENTKHIQRIYCLVDLFYISCDVFYKEMECRPKRRNRGEVRALAYGSSRHALPYLTYSNHNDDMEIGGRAAAIGHSQGVYGKVR